VKIGDPAEKEIVSKYGVQTAPMPLMLAVAPNGAVTRGIPQSFDEAKILASFVSPATEKCLKVLQEGKLPFICVQGETTKLNAEALKGIEDFKAQKDFTKMTEIVTVSPTDPAEATLLKQFDLAPKTGEAVTFFLARPGALLGKYKGATKKDTIAASLAAAMTGGGCCGGGTCAPGQSCDKK